MLKFSPREPNIHGSEKRKQNHNHVRIHVTENTAPSKPVKGHTVLPIEAPNHQSHPWKHKQPGNDRMQPVDGCAQVIHRIACMDRSMASLFFSLRSPPPCKQAGKSSMELMAARLGNRARARPRSRA